MSDADAAPTHFEITVGFPADEPQDGEAGRNRAFVSDVLRRLAAGEGDALAKAMAPDVALHLPLALPYGGSWHGLEAVLGGLGGMFGAYREMRSEFRQLLAGGDSVVILIAFRGIVRGTGRAVSTQIAEQLRLKNGAIVEMRPFYFDAEAVAAAFA